MVVGDRLSTTYLEENNRKYHNFGNTFVRHIVNRLFRGNVKDIMPGYRAFSRDFVKSFPVISEGFEVETEMTIHALDKNMSVESVPVLYRNRPSGSVSKLNTFRDGFKVIFTIVKLYKDYKPLAFFFADRADFSCNQHLAVRPRDYRVSANWTCPQIPVTDYIRISFWPFSSL
jgi:hypothetical protein